MKILAITQARYGSTRLPAKILKKVNGMTLLEIHLRRILQSKLISKLKWRQPMRKVPDIL